MLELIDIHKYYERQPLLRGISLIIAEGETVCLLGPSGSGKSTLLRIIAGLETPERGQVCWDGSDLEFIPAHRRGFGMVFQDYALFPHLDVAENVAFGLKMKKLSSREIEFRVEEILDSVNLKRFRMRQVTDLSGGEQQRVALARALAPNPRLLMFDEPLGALDRNLREQLMYELRNTLHKSGVPAIYVTHDQEEAFTLADRVLLLHDGMIVSNGTPEQIWSNPGSVWAAQFLDAGNVVPGIVIANEGRLQVKTSVGVFELVCRSSHAIGEKINLLISRHGVQRSVQDNLGGVVLDVIFQLNGFKVTLDNGLIFYLSEAPRLGEKINLDIPEIGIRCLA